MEFKPSPCGFTSAGLPIRLQISAATFAETTMLAPGHAYEQATESHTRRRPYRTFTIPVSIFAREWQKVTGHEPEAAEVIRRRLALATRR